MLSYVVIILNCFLHFHSERTRTARSYTQSGKYSIFPHNNHSLTMMRRSISVYNTVNYFVAGFIKVFVWGQSCFGFVNRNHKYALQD